MKKGLSKIIFVFILALFIAVDAFACFISNQKGKPGPAPDKSNLIQLNSPQAYQEIQSPLLIEGRARGFWFFEADFPVKLLDGNGNLIAHGIAQAQSDWMTEDFVPFKATLVFKTPTTKSGWLVLEKDNPSGLPENADELRIPIRFSL